MREVRLRAYAKVNYALDVLGLRGDGYHEVRTVMQSISLADEVELQRSTGDFELSTVPDEVGPLEHNTVYLAWKSLRTLTGDELPVSVTLRKKIPTGAGLGGGSADAAAILVGLNDGMSCGPTREPRALATQQLNERPVPVVPRDVAVCKPIQSIDQSDRVDRPSRTDAQSRR